LNMIGKANERGQGGIGTLERHQGSKSSPEEEAIKPCLCKTDIASRMLHTDCTLRANKAGRMLHAAGCASASCRKMC